MATFNKFYSFSEAIAEKKHNLGSDTLKVALTNTLPTTANTVLADITEIAYTYCSTRNLTTSSSSQTGVVIYNDTATNKELIGWYDAGSAITIPDTGTFLLDLSQVTGLLSIS